MKTLSLVRRMGVLAYAMLLPLSGHAQSPWYRDARYGFAFQLPGEMTHIDNPFEGSFDAQMIEVQANENLRMVLSVFPATVVDSQLVREEAEVMERVYAVVPGARISRPEQLIQVSNHAGTYAQIVQPYFGATRFLARTFVSNSRIGLLIKFWSDFPDSESAIAAARLAQRTLVLSDSGEEWSQDPDPWPHLPGFNQQMEALSQVYDQHLWDTAGLTKAVAVVRRSVGLKVDFATPPPSLRPYVAQRKDPSWRSFLNLFFIGNVIAWTPSETKRLRLGDSANVRVSALSDSIQRMTVELRRWRVLVLSTPDSAVTLRMHTDAGSGRTVGEVLTEVKDRQGSLLGGQADDVDTTGAIVLRSWARMALHSDPPVDFAAFARDDDGFVAAYVAITALYDVVTRGIATANPLRTMVHPPREIDIFLYRDHTSFRGAMDALRSQGITSTHERSFAVSRRDQVGVHVVADRDAATLHTIARGRIEKAGVLGLLSNGDSIVTEASDSAARVWSHRLTAISSTISHELDHVLMAREFGRRPAWFLEGQATFYGEAHAALNAMGLAIGEGERGPFYGSLGDTLRALADTVLPMLRSGPVPAALDARYLDVAERALRANALISDRARTYLDLLGQRDTSHLADEFRRLVLTPDEDFQAPDRVILNYALAWAMVKATRDGEVMASPAWVRHRAAWTSLSGSTLAVTRDSTFAGSYNSLFNWFASEIRRWVREEPQ